MLLGIFWSTNKQDLRVVKHCLIMGCILLRQRRLHKQYAWEHLQQCVHYHTRVIVGTPAASHSTTRARWLCHAAPFSGATPRTKLPAAGLSPARISTGKPNSLWFCSLSKVRIHNDWYLQSTSLLLQEFLAKKSTVSTGLTWSCDARAHPRRLMASSSTLPRQVSSAKKHVQASLS